MWDCMRQGDCSGQKADKVCLVTGPNLEGRVHDLKNYKSKRKRLECSHLRCGCILSRENGVEGVGCGLTVPKTDWRKRIVSGVQIIFVCFIFLPAGFVHLIPMGGVKSIQRLLLLCSDISFAV